MKCAIIENNIVTNTVVIDNAANWVFGGTAVPLNANEPCSIGDTYDENGNPRFTTPPENP